MINNIIAAVIAGSVYAGSIQAVGYFGFQGVNVVVFLSSYWLIAFGTLAYFGGKSLMRSQGCW